MADDKAAFGVFPHLKAKRSKQDAEAAKNVPVDLARGALSGVLGAPGDIESLIRLLPGLSEETILPTSEDIEKRIPFRSESPVSQAATGLGQLAGGFYTGKGSPLNLAGKTAKFAGKGAAEMIERGMFGEGPLAPITPKVLPLDVWHGSPHKFAPTPKNPLGEFDPTKIGTGEGAQAYGHGHYTAEAKGVGSSYQPRSPEYEQKLLTLYEQARRRSNYPMMEVLEDAMLHKDPEDILAKFGNAEDGYTPQHMKAAKEFASWYEKNPPEVGALYKVDLSDEAIPRMLDWEKPLSEQAHLKEALNAIQKEIALPKMQEGEGGGFAYQHLANALGGQENASKLLRHQGIPGIKYLDEGSRGGGEGTRNFVVFPGEEDLLNILERKKEGGSVSISDNPDRMMLELEERKMAGGGVIRKGIKGLFSKVDEVAQGLSRTKGTGAEFMKELEKAKGVKPAEIQHRKLEEIKALPKMTKEEFIGELNKRPPAQLEEKVLGEPKLSQEDIEATEGLSRDEAIRYLGLEEDRPKFNRPDLVLPGGENYREILLKLPSSKKKESWEWFDPINQESQGGFATQQEAYDARPNIGAVVNRVKTQVGPQDYRSSHWDEPNVIAHARVSDRTGPNGEKVLHVEEIQSDWHQAGRKKGYQSGKKPANINDISVVEEGPYHWIVKDPDGVQRRVSKADYEFLGENALNKVKVDVASAYNSKFADKDKYAVPDAPFKKNWHELMMNKVLADAAEGGYDRVVITPGAEQAERYDLSKHIYALTYDPKKKKLVAYDPEWSRVLDQSNVEPNQIPDYVGKDVAKRLIESPIEEARGYHRITGEDLKIGGEGMKGFYDKMLPDYLNSLGKKYGVQVETYSHPLGYDDESKRLINEAYARGSREDIDAANAAAKQKTADLHSFKITPEMRQEFTEKGFPMYSVAAPVGLGATQIEPQQPQQPVQITDNPDAMMMEVEDKKFAGGGLLKKGLQALKGAQEVLPAVEREANLQKFLEPSVVKDRMYHGSSNPNIQQFKTGKMRKEEHYPNNTIEPWAVDNRDAVFLTPEPEFSSKYSGGDWEVQGGYSPTTYPVYVQAKKPWDYDDPKHLEQVIEAYKEKYPLKRDKSGAVPSDESMRHRHFETNVRELPLREVSNWSGIEKADLQDIIKDLGYDSFFVKENGVKNLGVYDPSKIKSATGNKGTYDTSKPNINEAIGGLIKVKHKRKAKA